MSRCQPNLCESCIHSYIEYGWLLCKFEGTNDVVIPEDGVVTECGKYEEEVDYVME